MEMPMLEHLGYFLAVNGNSANILSFFFFIMMRRKKRLLF
jgi:hypothetical protein